MYPKIIVTACRSFIRGLFLILIRAYQKCISPFLGDHCRFYPSCSQYAYDAMTVHAISKALYLIMRRLLRCHPFNPGGIDPVLPREHS